MNVGFLDYSDLQCCSKPMVVMPDNWGYGCTQCGWHLTQIEFLRNSHGTPEARRARITNQEVGAPRLRAVNVDTGEIRSLLGQVTRAA